MNPWTFQIAGANSTIWLENKDECVGSFGNKPTLVDFRVWLIHKIVLFITKRLGAIQEYIVGTKISIEIEKDHFIKSYEHKNMYNKTKFIIFNWTSKGISSEKNKSKIFFYYFKVML